MTWIWANFEDRDVINQNILHIKLRIWKIFEPKKFRYISIFPWFVVAASLIFCHNKHFVQIQSEEISIPIFFNLHQMHNWQSLLFQCWVGERE